MGGGGGGASPATPSLDETMRAYLCGAFQSDHVILYTVRIGCLISSFASINLLMFY